MSKYKGHIKEPNTSRIDELSNSDSFNTPENYFQDFSARITEMTQGMPAASSVAGKSLLQQLISQPWVMTAAAAVIGGLILTTVLLTNNDSNNNTTPQQSTIVAEKDSSNTKNKSSKTIRNTSNGQQNAIADNEPAPQQQQSEEKAFTMAPDKKDTQKKTPSEPSNSKHKGTGTPASGEKQHYADNTLNQAATNNTNSTVSQNNTGSNGTEEKTAVASDDAIPDICFFEDSCISTPAWFILPNPGRAYRLSWDNRTESDSLLIKESGIYSATLYNSEGKALQTYSFELRYLPKPEISLPSRHSICVGKNLKLDPGFYSEEYSFQWSDGVESPVNFVSSEQPQARIYSLQIIGCESYSWQTTVVFEPCDLTIPNVITPNGDGKNDYFVIKGLSNYPGSKLLIMDRSGQEVYRSDNYQNDFNGAGLARGSYYYILKINNNSQTVKKGNLNIVY